MDFKPFIAEFIGTFALVFIGAGAVVVDYASQGGIGIVGIALAHGLVLSAMIYSLAHISGAHFNPAVTIAMLANKRIALQPAISYIISQLAGASVAGLLLASIFSGLAPAAIYGFPPTYGLGPGILIEAVLTFFLVLTIYGVAVSKKAPEAIFGFAIGSVLVFDIIFGGLLTGGAMNPARAFGPALASGIWEPQPIYWIGPIIGALVASFAYEKLLMGKK